MSLNIDIDSSAEQDLDFHLPDFSISFPQIQRRPPDHYGPHSPTRIEAIDEITDTNYGKRNTASLSKIFKKDRWDRHDSKSKSNLKIRQLNEKNKQDK